MADVLDVPYYYWYGHLGKIILYNRLEINWLPVAKTKIHLIMYCIVLYCIVLYCIVLYCIVFIKQCVKPQLQVPVYQVTHHKMVILLSSSLTFFNLADQGLIQGFEKGEAQLSRPLASRAFPLPVPLEVGPP